MTQTGGEIAQCFCTWSLPNDELFCQEHSVGRLVTSSNNNIIIIYQEDRDFQLAIFMDKSTPQVGLRNLCWIPNPLHDLTAYLDI